MALHQEYSNGLLLAWPTPILRRNVDDASLLSALRDQILAREEDDPEGMPRALVNGWHSRLDLMEWPGDAIADLKQHIGDALSDFMTMMANGRHVSGTAHITAWANISRRGGFHRLHTHHSSMISGVFYVDIGVADPEDTAFNGSLTFVDPRQAVEMIPMPGQPFGEKIKFDPKPGMLLLFPSWLKHFVDPFRGEGTRISIAFNIAMPDARVADAGTGQSMEKQSS